MHQVGYSLPINIGNPEEFRVAELAGLVKELCQTKSAIRYEVLPPDDLKRENQILVKVKIS